MLSKSLSTKRQKESVDYIQNLGFNLLESEKLIKSLQDMKQETNISTLKVCTL